MKARSRSDAARGLKCPSLCLDRHHHRRTCEKRRGRGDAWVAWSRRDCLALPLPGCCSSIVMKRIVGADRKVGIATEFVDGEHDTEEEVSHCYKCKAGRVTFGGTLINIHRPQWGWNAFSSPNSRAGGEQRRFSTTAPKPHSTYRLIYKARILCFPYAHSDSG